MLAKKKDVRHQTGLTLIELVIAVAIIGILAAVAWPTFERQSAKNRRADAAIALTNARQALIHFRSDNGGYPSSAANALAALRNYRPTAPNSPPLDCKGERGYQVPAGGGVVSCQNYYTISVTAADANSFTLRATPNVADTECGNLELDHLGTRTVTGGAPAKRCWAE